MLPTIMTLGEFFQDNAQFMFYCFLDNKEKVFFRFTLGS